MSCCLTGANVNAAKLHETALHHAAKVRNVDLIEMLIEFGGNIYARDNRGKKPSDYTWSSSAPAKCFEFYESKARTGLLESWEGALENQRKHWGGRLEIWGVYRGT